MGHTWNFRAVKKDDHIAIHYAYYNDKGELESLSELAASPLCEDPQDLRGTLELMLQACQDAVVDFGTLKPVADDILTKDPSGGCLRSSPPD